MKVLWCVPMLLPEFAAFLGAAKPNQGGWLPSLVSAIRALAPDIKLTILSEGSKCVSANLDGVRYISAGRARKGIFRRSISREFSDCVAKVISDERPDIVHIHGTEGMWATLPQKIWCGIPVIASIQGILAGYYPHYTGGLLPGEVRSWRNLLNFLLTRWSVYHGAETWRRIKVPKEMAAFANIGHFLGRTDWDLAWTRYLAPDAQYHAVGEVLRDPFYRGGRTSSRVVPHSIFCGASFSYPLKGGHWLIRAVASLKRKYPDVQLRVANAQRAQVTHGVRAFLRQGEYHRYLSRLIDELGLRKNVVLLPSLTDEEVADELKRAAVFCLPSLCENSPNSLGEAMIMECPCVATDVGGVSSILQAGKNGTLVPSADPAALAMAIDRVFTGNDDVGDQVRHAKAFANQFYSASHIVQQLETAYNDMEGIS